MKQKAAVLNHMRNRGSITTYIAFSRYRITRLSERIRELKADLRRARKPAQIINTPIHRFGKRWMAYSLVVGKRAAA